MKSYEYRNESKNYGLYPKRTRFYGNFKLYTATILVALITEKK